MTSCVGILVRRGVPSNKSQKIFINKNWKATTVTSPLSSLIQIFSIFDSGQLRKHAWKVYSQADDAYCRSACKSPRREPQIPLNYCTNDIPPHISRSKPYSMVIFNAVFISPIYEGDSYNDNKF